MNATPIAPQVRPTVLAADAQGIVFLTPHLGCFEVTAQGPLRRVRMHASDAQSPARSATATELRF